MNYTIKPSKDGKYIILKVVGEINSQSAMKQNLEAHTLGRELGIDRYLVDVTEARNTDSTLESYEFANKDMKETEGIDINAQVATLVSPGDNSHDFIETVARNSGLSVKIFIDPDLARQYLTGEKSPDKSRS
jgi:hypothetical protein